MIHRSPPTSFSCITTHWSRGVAISPGRQKILSTSITGSLVISPKRLARVDLPDAPRPMMTTRFIVSSLRRFQFGATVADCRTVALCGRAHVTPTTSSPSKEKL
jgi:hypothetical protein